MNTGSPGQPHPFPAKLMRPGLPDIFPRRRLFNLLAENQDQCAHWVCGPAGSGKTILVNSFLDDADTPCIWYDVDRQDADAAAFFYYMGKALGPLDEEPPPVLPLLTREFISGIPAFTRRYFELFSDRITAPFAIVLDNYHKAGKNTLLHEVVCHASDILRGKITLIICSREKPPAAFARLIAGSRLRLLGWPHLKLQEEETCGIIRSVSRTSYPEPVMAELHQKADGWVAALLLLIRKEEFDNIDPYQLTTHTPEEIFDYLGDTIFHVLDPGIRQTLLNLCYLPQISLHAAEILGGEEAAMILHQMNRQNVFTHINRGTPPEYQFHPLFREFLQKKAGELLMPEVREQLMVNSASLLAKEGKIEEAIHLNMKAGYPDAAIELILDMAPLLASQGRLQTLGDWIYDLPRTMVARMPWLLFWKGICKMPGSPERAKDLFKKALALFEEKADAVGCYMALSGILDSITFQFNVFQELDIYLDKYPVLEKRFGRVDQPDVMLRLTVAMLNALVLRRPNSPDTRKWSDQGMAILDRDKDINHTLMIFLPLIMLKNLQGDLPAAAHLLNMLQDSSRNSTNSLSYLILLDLKSFHSWLCGRFEEGVKAAQEGIAIEKKTGIILVYVGFRAHGAASFIGLGCHKKARELLEKITPVLSCQGIWMQGLYHYMYAWLNWVFGNLADSRLHAEACFEKANQSGNGVSVIGSNLLMAKIHHAAGEPQTAEFYLSEALRLSREYGARQDHFMILLTRAIFFLDDQKDTAAAGVLKDAFAIGRDQNYQYGFLWDPMEISRLCAFALKRNIETDYARFLVMTHNLILEKPPVDIPAWPWPLRLESFGGFSIIIREEPVGFSRKTQYKPLALLKYLMAAGGRKVPEHAIQDALWPDSDGDAARNAYTTTLHRLRKLVNIQDALIHEANHLSFNDHVVWTDIRAFERCCQKIDNRHSGKWSSQMGMNDLNELMSLYSGPFIPEEQAFWVIVERERLVLKFVNAVRKIAGQLDSKNKWEDAGQCYIEAIRVAPAQEAFCLGLMKIYVKMGKKSEAIRIYKRCERILMTASGQPPSREMRTLGASLK